MVELITAHVNEIIIGVGASLLTYTTVKNKILTNSLELTKYKAESELIQMLRNQIENLSDANAELSNTTSTSNKSAGDCEIELNKCRNLCSEYESKLQLQEALIAHLAAVLKDTRDSIQRL